MFAAHRECLLKYVRLIGFVTLVPFTLGLTAAPVLAASAKPADQPFRLSVLLDEKNGLELRWSVAPGYFLYRDKVSATLNGKVSFTESRSLRPSVCVTTSEAGPVEQVGATSRA